jgi:hypothetical protein
MAFLAFGMEMELDFGMRCAGELWDNAALAQDCYTQAGLGRI